MSGGRRPGTQDVLNPRATLTRPLVRPGVLLPEEPDTVSSVKCPCGPGPDLSRCVIIVHLHVGLSEGDCDRISLNVSKEPVCIFLQFIL